MTSTRRETLAACIAALPMAIGSRSVAGDRAAQPLGLVIHSFPVHVGVDKGKKPEDRFDEPARFLEYGRSPRGAGRSGAGIARTR